MREETALSTELSNILRRMRPWERDDNLESILHKLL